MAFQKNYQDNIRALRKELALVPKVDENPFMYKQDPFNEYVFELSEDEIDPLDIKDMYKKGTNLNTYQVQMPASAVFVRRNKNMFDILEAILPTVIPNCASVDIDFLTGYYLAACHLDLPTVMTSFHAGIAKDSFIRGIYDAVVKLRPKTKWQMFGCDSNISKKYRKILRNGVRSPCDIYNANTATSINIQLSESIPLNSINLYTCDVKPSSASDVLRQLMLILDYLTDDARIIIRLPANWQPYYTAMQTILLFCMCQFKIVRIFKTPWGAIPKYYLVLIGFKSRINARVIASINYYLTDLDANPNASMINNTYFDITDNELITRGIDTAYINMMGFDIKYTDSRVSDLFMSLIE